MVWTSPTFPKPMELVLEVQVTSPRPLTMPGGPVVGIPGTRISLPAPPSTPGVSASMTVLEPTLGAFSRHRFTISYLILRILQRVTQVS